MEIIKYIEHLETKLKESNEELEKYLPYSLKGKNIDNTTLSNIIPKGPYCMELDGRICYKPTSKNPQFGKLQLSFPANYVCPYLKYTREIYNKDGEITNIITESKCTLFDHIIKDGIKTCGINNNEMDIEIIEEESNKFYNSYRRG